MTAGVENVTILFTDMVGSTRLFSSLPPAAADVLRNRHLSLLRQAIAASNGTEVKNLGDGVMVAFTTASSALDGAVAMQQAVERENCSTGARVGLRIGLSCGEAAREDDDYFGDPVVEAARLCALAGDGQILASDVVKAMAGRRSAYTLEPVGAIELKGLPDPVVTHAVQWEADADADAGRRPPLPARLVHPPIVGMIGRTEPLAHLESMAKSTEAGEGRRLVLVSGEPGQGKTTMVADAARRAYERGVTVLFGRCDEDVGVAYRPFRELLGHLVTHASDAALRRHVDEYGGEIGRLVPALRQRAPGLPEPASTDPDAERYLLFGAVVGLLDAASADTPLMVVLDDLHWADTPTLQLLRHVVAHVSSGRILIVGTYRDAELSGVHPLTEALGALRREPGVSRRHLDGLDDLEVLSFMERAAGHELDDAGVTLAHAVYRETDGNPFFVAELLLHLSESGAIVQSADGRWSPARPDDEIVLPESVRQVIGARVSRVGDGAAKVLSAAAVIGQDFDLDLLAEVTGAGEDELLDLMDEAHAGFLVREAPDATGRYSFVHALIQRTLYDDLGSTRRTRTHIQVAEALERRFGDDASRASEIAHHYVLGTQPTHAEKAAVYARRAGEAALAALAPEEAVRFFTQALELLGHDHHAEPTTRVDILIGLGVAQRQAGLPAFRENLLQAARQARELGETQRMVAAALANNRGLFSSLGAVDDEKVAVLWDILAALPATDTVERARLLGNLCSELAYGPVDRRLALFRNAVAMARRLGDPATFVAVVNDCTIAIRLPWTLQEQLVNLRQAQAMARDLGDPLALFWSSIGLSIDATRAGCFGEADAAFDVAVGVADSIRQPTLSWVVGYHRVYRALVHGELTDIERLAESAFALGQESGQPDAFTFYGSQLMDIRYRQGRLGELVDLIAKAAEDAPASADVFLAALTEAHLEGGDDTTARRMLDRAAASDFTVFEDLAWSVTMTCYARVAIELDAAAAAAAILERLAPWAGETPTPGTVALPPVASVLGGLCAVTGRYDDAEAYFVQAAGLCERGSMRFDEAYTNLLQGRMLLRRGDADRVARGRELLTEAGRAAAARGYAKIGERAAEALAAMSA